MPTLLLLIVLMSVPTSRLAAQEVQSCNKTRLPESINSFQPTTQPVLSPDGRLFLDRKLHPGNGDGITDPDDVWIAERRSELAWAEPTQAPFTTFKRPDVVFNFTPDGLNALVVGPYGAGSPTPGPAFAIISRRTKDALFDKMEVLPVGALSKNYYGFLSADRRTVLVALERADGVGDLDLYCMTRCNASWSNVRSLGTQINSVGVEGAPWLAMDGTTLYFISNGREDRKGKSDVYMSKRRGDDWQEWTIPVNLGACVNSQDDETSVSLSPSESTALLTSWDTVSERPGVYSVTIPAEFRPSAVCRYAADVIDGVSGEAIVDYRISIRDSTHDSDTCARSEFFSDTIHGTSLLPIPEGRSYVLETSSDNYTSHAQTITVRTLDSTVELRTTVRLFNLSKPLASVYFDRGSAVLSDSGRSAIATMLQTYSSIKLKFFVDGYTDRVGGTESNKELSAARATTVSALLVALGLDPDRIILAAKGVERLPGVYDEEYPQSRRVDVFARTER